MAEWVYFGSNGTSGHAASGPLLTKLSIKFMTTDEARIFRFEDEVFDGSNWTIKPTYVVVPYERAEVHTVGSEPTKNDTRFLLDQILHAKRSIMNLHRALSIVRDHVTFISATGYEQSGQFARLMGEVTRWTTS